MSSTAPIQDVAEVLHRMTANGKEIEVCLWFRCHLGTITTARLTTIATRTHSRWRNNFRGQLGIGTLFRETVAIDRSPSPIAPITIIENTLGGSNSEASPTSIALGFLNLTDNIPTFPRSESFIPAIPEGRIDAGIIDITWATAMLGLWATNNQSHGPFGWHHVCVSLYAGGTPRAMGFVERATHYALARLNPAAQRRRLTGR